MINKKHLADGLLQLAIVVSLTRTDLNNQQQHQQQLYEINLGQSSAYTQTNFQPNSWNSHYGYAHPKNIDSYYSSELFQDLHQLSWYRRFEGVQTYVGAWLVNEPPSFPLSSEHASTSGTAPEQQSSSNGGNIQAPSLQENEDHNHDHEQQPQDAVVLVGAQSSTISDDLTKEDMEMIDVLWRQDIDLGILREHFDINHQKELEMQYERDLVKQQETEKEMEKDEQEAEANVSYAVDGETGEKVIIPETKEDEDTESSSQNLDQTIATNLDDEMFSIEEAMNLLEREGSEVIENGGEISTMIDPMTNLTTNLTDMQQQLDNMMSADPSQVPIPPQQPKEEINNTETSPQDNASLFRRQDSLDLVFNDLMAMTSNSTNVTTMAAPEMSTGLLQNATMPPPLVNTTATQNYNDSLMNMLSIDQTPYSNTTMSFPPSPLVPTMDLNQSMPNSPSMSGMQPAISLPDALYANVSLANPPTNFYSNASVNSTAPSQQAPAPVVIQPSAAIGSSNPLDLLPRGGAPLEARPIGVMCPDDSLFNSTGQFIGGSFLDNLMESDGEDEGVQGMDFTYTNVSDSLNAARYVDDAGSDSAVSGLGSGSTHSQDIDEISSNFSDQFSSSGEPQGATGGEGFKFIDTKPIPKYNDELERYSRHDDFKSHSTGRYSSPSNASDSEFISRGGAERHLAEERHIKHNHTYPSKLGENSAPIQEIKKEATDKGYKDSKQELAASMSRDEKRIKNMGIPLCLEDIVMTPVDSFNDLLKEYQFSDNQLQIIRDIRRRGKNKVAAQNCRKRKITKILTLDDEVDDLRESCEKMRQEHDSLKNQVSNMTGKYDQLYSEVFASLRDDSGQPYDPERFSLQHTSDGNVFIVPVNRTMSIAQRPNRATTSAQGAASRAPSRRGRSKIVKKKKNKK